MKQIPESEMVSIEREFVEFWRHPFTIRLLIFLRANSSTIRETVVPSAAPDKVQYWIGFTDGLVAALENKAPECMQKSIERLRAEIAAREFAKETISEEVADGAIRRDAVYNAPAEPENSGDGRIARIHGGKRRLVAASVSAAFHRHNGTNQVPDVPTDGEGAGEPHRNDGD